ncbi:histidine kinase sensor domain-containing protein [Marinomonas sp. C2222]|uniref:histidine kinase n=1 Tax=Marinomonas sargassi TaxID=2984494 RepID=A0ABT2YV19_9GAMM|nr:histidine kinase sensor domain-containing protein [Marinomonas sargassi]MCV2403749.1 histidine kinase sensor domain-containing protein [Marinomonas sargassi]
MKNSLLWKLFAVIAVGTVVFFWLVDLVASHTEDSMSYIDQEYRAELRAYAKEAERLLYDEGEEILSKWVKGIEEKEDTWIAISRPSIENLADTQLSERYISTFSLGRDLEWKIHLYFAGNPTMDIPFEDGITRFLIQLPQRMRPGKNLFIIDLLLQIALPFLILCLLTYVLYRYMMKPLKKLEKATRHFSEGHFHVRASEGLSHRQDELTALASTFDQMATRISTLIVDQRQLLADLSHELRTPLTRLNIAVDCVEHNQNSKEELERLRYESANMQALIDDALTLAWFNTESPKLELESVELTSLLQVLVEDARFEFSNHKVTLNQPDKDIYISSAQQALSAALENIIRNGLSHTPEGKTVNIQLTERKSSLAICVEDQGIGVPDEYLEDIFKPFFRIKEKNSDNARIVSSKKSGYGLGLALAQRQILALGGSIKASNMLDDNGERTGLAICIHIPYDGESL